MMMSLWCSLYHWRVRLRLVVELHPVHQQCLLAEAFSGFDQEGQVLFGADRLFEPVFDVHEVLLEVLAVVLFEVVAAHCSRCTG